MLKIRDMLRSDLIHVTPMYRAMIKEAKADPAFVDYPKVFDDSFEEFTYDTLRILGEQIEKDWHQNIKFLSAVHGGVAKGFSIGMIGTRPFFQPKVFMQGLLLYVEPQFREQGIGNELIKQLCDWGRSHGAGAFEAWTIPGSFAHRRWHGAGMKVYNASLVFADKDMNVITDSGPRLEKIEEKKEAANG